MTVRNLPALALNVIFTPCGSAFSYSITDHLFDKSKSPLGSAPASPE